VDICFVCGKKLIIDPSGSGRKICPLCGNAQSTVYLQVPDTISDDE
jgi:hypothetical protein